MLQSAAYIITAALRDLDWGNPSRGNALLQHMSQMLHGQATATQLGPQLQQAAREVRQHPILGKETEATNNAAWLAKSVQQLVKLEQPVPSQQPAVAQQLPTPKHRRPKL